VNENGVKINNESLYKFINILNETQTKALLDVDYMSSQFKKNDVTDFVDEFIYDINILLRQYENYSKVRENIITAIQLDSHRTNLTTTEFCLILCKFSIHELVL
jgi:hypothetical protein